MLIQLPYHFPNKLHNSQQFIVIGDMNASIGSITSDSISRHEAAIEVVKKLETDFQENAASQCSWGCKMVLPPGLLEF